jgi:hypothetical protein
MEKQLNLISIFMMFQDIKLTHKNKFLYMSNKELETEFENSTICNSNMKHEIIRNTS